MITLFEEGLDDEYYVSLKMSSTETDELFINSYAAQSVTIIETMLSSSTYLNVRFVDGTGELIHTKAIIPDSEFELFYGTNRDVSLKSLFKLSNIKLLQENTTDIDSIGIKADLIHNKW